jgi:uncharacterized protein YbaR (Trm112 family)
MIDSFLLKVLACPRCESRPPLREEKQFLICTECEWAYRVVEGIPDMLVEDAVSPDDWKAELNRG